MLILILLLVAAIAATIANAVAISLEIKPIQQLTIEAVVNARGCSYELVNMEKRGNFGAPFCNKLRQRVPFDRALGCRVDTETFANHRLICSCKSSSIN